MFSKFRWALEFMIDAVFLGLGGTYFIQGHIMWGIAWAILGIVALTFDVLSVRQDRKNS